MISVQTDETVMIHPAYIHMYKYTYIYVISTSLLEREGQMNASAVGKCKFFSSIESRKHVVLYRMLVCPSLFGTNNPICLFDPIWQYTFFSREICFPPTISMFFLDEFLRITFEGGWFW